MVDPEVASESVTLCVLVYDPAPGLSVGMATWNVYVAESMAESAKFDLVAIALTVVVDATENPVVYVRVPPVQDPLDTVGVDPLTV